MEEFEVVQGFECKLQDKWGLRIIISAGSFVFPVLLKTAQSFSTNFECKLETISLNQNIFVRVKVRLGNFVANCFLVQPYFS